MKSYELQKVWKDEKGRRWYLFNTDPYPYVSATSVVAIAKTFRYKDLKKDDKAAKRLKQAADIGTNIHAMLEFDNRVSANLPPIEVDPKIFVRYEKIRNNYKALVLGIENSEGPVKVIEVERQCLHPVYKYAGRFDLLVTVNGEYEIWDYKTSKGIHEEDGWQLCAYMYALRLEGIDVKRVRIIHIDKIGGKVTDLKYKNHEFMFIRFLSCIDIFRGMFFNDLYKGRIQDIDDLGVQYKYPLEVLINSAVIHFNNNRT